MIISRHPWRCIGTIQILINIFISSSFRSTVKIHKYKYKFWFILFKFRTSFPPVLSFPHFIAFISYFAYNKQNLLKYGLPSVLGFNILLFQLPHKHRALAFKAARMFIFALFQNRGLQSSKPQFTTPSKGCGDKRSEMVES